jgi:hypothetical protein
MAATDEEARSVSFSSGDTFSPKTANNGKALQAQLL